MAKSVENCLKTAPDSDDSPFILTRCVFYYLQQSIPSRVALRGKIVCYQIGLGFDPRPVYNIPTSCETPANEHHHSLWRTVTPCHRPASATPPPARRRHLGRSAADITFAGVDLGYAHPYHVFFNHRHIVPEQWEHTPLHEGDVVHIVIPALGGAR